MSAGAPVRAASVLQFPKLRGWKRRVPWTAGHRALVAAILDVMRAHGLKSKLAAMTLMCREIEKSPLYRDTGERVSVGCIEAIGNRRNAYPKLKLALALEERFGIPVRDWLLRL